MTSQPSVSDITNSFLNHDTSSPTGSLFSRPMSHRPSHFFQCGSSLYFINTHHKHSQFVHELNTETNEWMTPYRLGALHGLGVNYFTMASSGRVRGWDKAYWYGGSEMYCYTPMNMLIEYDDAKKSWNKVEPTVAIDSTGGEYPGLVYCHASDSHGDCLITFSGYNDQAEVGEETYLNELHRFDFESMAWSKIPYVDGPSPRSGASMVYLPELDAVLMYGGSEKFDELWMLKLKDYTWKQVVAMGKAPNNHSLCIVGLDTRFVVLQQHEATREMQIFILNCKTLHWQMYNTGLVLGYSGFAAVFQPKLDNLEQLLLYLTLGDQYQIYSIDLCCSKIPQKLYEAYQRHHLCDVTIQYNNQRTSD